MVDEWLIPVNVWSCIEWEQHRTLVNILAGDTGCECPAHAELPSLMLVRDAWNPIIASQLDAMQFDKGTDYKQLLS